MEESLTEMKQPAVSVIIPNYCHARYLDERIRSVLGQSFGDFEVIILDDCSTDGSREVIERWRGEPHIAHIVYNEQNSGSTFRQWQKGFELAAGRYIWIAESDDAARPEFLENCVAALDANPSASVAFTDCLYIDAGSNVTGRTRNSEKLARRSRGGAVLYSGRDFIRDRMLLRNYIVNASMALFRKSAIPADTAYAEFRYVGDWLFWSECALNGDVIYIDKPLDLFRQHGDNTTAKSVVGGKNFLESLRFLGCILPKMTPPPGPGYTRYLCGKYLAPVWRRRRSCPGLLDEACDILRSSGCRHPLGCFIWYRLVRPFSLYSH